MNNDKAHIITKRSSNIKFTISNALGGIGKTSRLQKVKIWSEEKFRDITQAVSSC